jgi:hypothetical protein
MGLMVLRDNRGAEPAEVGLVWGCRMGSDKKTFAPWCRARKLTDRKEIDMMGYNKSQGTPGMYLEDIYRRSKGRLATSE